MAARLEQQLQSLPPNWTEDVLYSENLTTVIRDDGIPLVWVPRAEIVAEVLAAPDRTARIAVLLSRQSEIAEDCLARLAEISHESLEAQQPLAMRALEAFAAGHCEAAQALAVVVTETAVAREFPGKDYKEIKQEINFDLERAYLTEIRVQAALTPISTFYTPWKREWGKPAPKVLSRHVTVHQADAGQYTRGNAAVAVLLVTSVLRALQDLREQKERTWAN